MKEGWTYKKLGEIARVQNGFAFDSKLFNEMGNGTPLIRIRDIKRGYSETFTTEKCEEDYYIKDGDLIIGMDGDFNVCIWKGGHAFLNQRVCHVIPSKVILTRYIYYFLPFPLQQINDKTAYSTVKHLSSKQVNSIIVPLPSLSEQRSIVSRLDTAFANIDALKANAEKQLNEVRKLFQAELTECMRPKEGWEEKTLGDICSKITDGSHNPPKGVVHSDNMMLSSQNVQNGFLDLSSVRYLSKNDFDKENLRTRASKGDVLLTIVGTIGRTCVLTGDEGNITFQRSVSILKPEDEIDSYFLMYYLMSQNESLNKKAQGAAQKGIYLKQLANCVISYPTLINQQQIVSHLNSMNEKVRELEEIQRKTITECEALKQAMLKEVFE